jgi:hypothetical protein
MGTRTPWATLLAQYADNTSGDITPERLRNFVQSARPHAAAADPTINSDSASGFDVGHGWLNTSTPALFECVDASAGAAVWVQVYPAATAAHTHTLAEITDAGTAAAAATTDFATATQGATADTAVQPGDPLTDLSSGAAASGHVPKADGTGGIAWAAESGGGASALNDLTDVDTTGQANGDYLRLDTSAYKPHTLTAGFTKMVALTESEYAALTPDANTIYFIEDDPA